jgi:hypothetical protein
MMTGLPLTWAPEGVFPWVEATTKVLPVALGVGVGFMSISIFNFPPSIFAVMLMVADLLFGLGRCAPVLG